MLSYLFEKDLLPDFLIRSYIRKLCRQRMREENKGNAERQAEHFDRLLQALKTGPIAVQTAKANEQHYELPTLFFQRVLGKHMKYSGCLWDQPAANLDEAENKMLSLCCERAQVKEGQDILELGCGWGSLTLFLAERYPSSSVTAVSNSRTQKLFIDQRAAERGLKNVEVITTDINDFSTGKKFDRVVSIEMFEHIRNYRALFEKIAGVLKQEGKLFVHIFCHREYTYLFEVKDKTDWMAKYFFSGGIMPGKNLFHHFTEHLKVAAQWEVNGNHYRKTAEAWLRNMDTHKGEIMPVLEETYGKNQALKWWVYWKTFFMSCEELFGFGNGNEWQVSHYLFENRG